MSSQKGKSFRTAVESETEEHLLSARKHFDKSAIERFGLPEKRVISQSSVTLGPWLCYKFEDKFYIKEEEKDTCPKLPLQKQYRVAFADFYRAKEIRRERKGRRFCVALT